MITSQLRAQDVNDWWTKYNQSAKLDIPLTLLCLMFTTYRFSHAEHFPILGFAFYPSKVIKKNEQVCVAFIWKGKEGSIQGARVKWEALCTPRNEVA